MVRDPERWRRASEFQGTEESKGGLECLYTALSNVVTLAQSSEKGNSGLEFYSYKAHLITS